MYVCINEGQARTADQQEGDAVGGDGGAPAVDGLDSCSTVEPRALAHCIRVSPGASGHGVGSPL